MEVLSGPLPRIYKISLKFFSGYESANISLELPGTTESRTLGLVFL